MLLENNSYPGDTRVRREATSLVEFGYTVTVIAPKAEGEAWFANENGVFVYRYPDPGGGESALGYLWEYGFSLLASAVLSIWVFLRRGFDVIHAHSPPDSFVIIAMFYWPFRVKFVFDHHDISPEMYVARFRGKGNKLVIRLLTFFEGLSCRYASKIITVNESYRELVIERHRLPAEKITVVRNGPDMKELYPVEPDEQILAKNWSVFGYVGVMGFQDGVDSLIRALHHLREDLGRSDFYCILIGRGASVGYLKDLTKQLGLDEHVFFTGYVSDDELRRYLSTADVCVAPDPFNPFNDRSTMIKVMEYMAFAKPIVAYKLVEHQVTAEDAALYAETCNELDFARKLETLMDDPGLRAKLGTNGRVRAETVLEWQHQKVHLKQAYSTLLG